MFNEEQEDEIRNLLTIVVLYFQVDDKLNNGKLDEAKDRCKDAIKKLVRVMKFDGRNTFHKKEEPKKDNLIDKIKLINDNPFF